MSAHHVYEDARLRRPPGCGQPAGGRGGGLHRGLHEPGVARSPATPTRPSRRRGRCSTRRARRARRSSSRRSATAKTTSSVPRCSSRRRRRSRRCAPARRWVEVDARLGRAAGGAGAREALRVRVLRHGPRRAAARRGCDTVIVTGASTSGCVRATAVDALQYGYRVLVPRDGVADRAPDAHNGLASRHRREVRRRDLDRRGDRRRRRRRPRRAQAGMTRPRRRSPRRDPRRVRRRRVGGDGRAPRASSASRARSSSATPS